MKSESGSHPTVREVARPVTFIESTRLNKRLGLEITIATETFQHTGSFKFRAAYNVAANIPRRRIIAASSGNFGQALAFACQLLGKSCCVVMPETSAKIKVEAVREFGGEVDFVDVRRISRAARVRELAALDPEAYVASAYDDPLVIEGNATLGLEIAESKKTFGIVIAPIGGGGLTSGILKAFRQRGYGAKLHAAEPLTANDAARSFRSGERIVDSVESQTIADGARTPGLGTNNWAILRDGLASVIEVTEDQIKEAVRLLFTHANLKVEPTGALGLGALLAAPEIFRGQAICGVASGGNVDPAVFREILEH